MAERFPSQFLAFARSVDIVSSNTVESVGRQIKRYLGQRFEFMEFLKKETLRDVPYLCTAWWNMQSAKDAYPIRQDGKMNGQSSCAILTGKPMWIVGGNSECLTSAEEYIDLWSNVHSMPPYFAAPHKCNMKTSVLLPIFEGENAFALVNFESTERLDFTERASADLMMIAQAMALIISRFEAFMAQQRGTGETLQTLGSCAHQMIQTETPTVFVATPVKCDARIVSVIKDVLSAHAEKLKTVFWKDIAESGNVDQQILKSISESAFGVCYLSERTGTKAKPGYRDNPNVLFEAGMLHALSHDPTATPQSWVPIRESACDAPFDLAHERMIIVDRNRDGGANVKRLETKLRRIITKWVNAG